MPGAMSKAATCALYRWIDLVQSLSYALVIYALISLSLRRSAVRASPAGPLEWKRGA